MSVEPTPKDRFTCLDALAVARELRALGPARVEKAFDRVDGGWSLGIHPPGGAKVELAIVPGRYAALGPAGEDHSEELSPIARDLRRLLTGAIVRTVADPGAERYLEVALARADAPDGLRLAVEFFGTGNLVVARGPTIALVVHPKAWAHRTLRIGAPYVRPPSRADPFAMDAGAIEQELRRSRSDLASTLAARLALGGPVAEEIVARAGASRETPAADPAGTAREIRRRLDELLAEIGDRPRGHLRRRDGELVDASPFVARRWDGVAAAEERSTFSEAARAYFPTAIERPPSPEEVEARRATAERARLLERQRTAVAELAALVVELRADADAILANFPAAEAALAAAVEDAARPAETTAELGGRTVRLAVGRPAREVARLRYEEAKRVGEKLAGARAALAETEGRAEVARPVPSVRARPSAAPTGRPFWFERYRWFVSSDGTVVIAGRDAASNDLVVRRNLKEGDVYVHADLHGAASVVVKRPSPAGTISDASLREAAQWAVAYSKAWRAGYASGSAFWATPDQVSKAAASGEFVARGAWVIHGTKHFVRDVPLELALGPIRYEGRERWTAAPVEAVRARGEVRCVVVPGEERTRSDVEVELARGLGVPRPLLQALLPAGGLTVRRP